MTIATDHYSPRNMFRREVFDKCLNFLESESLNEKAVCECLKECLEFFWSGASKEVVRDFCIVKVQRGHHAQA